MKIWEKIKKRIRPRRRMVTLEEFLANHDGPVIVATKPKQKPAEKTHER